MHKGLRVVASSLTLPLFGASLFIHQAYAAITICRTDPIVVLTDGRQLTITDTVSLESGSTLQSIHYDVHGPVGTQIHKIMYTANAPAGLESVTYIADQRGSTTFSVTGTTNSTNAADTVRESVSVYRNGKLLATGSASGYSGAPGVTINLSY